RGRLGERVRRVDGRVSRVLVRLDEDVAAAELAPVVLIARVDGVWRDRDALGRRRRIEDRPLLDRVERAALVGRLLLRDLRIVLVSRRDAELDVEARQRVFQLALVVARWDHATVETERGLQIVGVVLVARGPRDEPDNEEQDPGKDDDVQGLLPAFALPASEALPAGEAWKRDPSGHLETSNDRGQRRTLR